LETRIRENIKLIFSSILLRYCLFLLFILFSTFSFAQIQISESALIYVQDGARIYGSDDIPEEHHHLAETSTSKDTVVFVSKGTVIVDLSPEPAFAYRTQEAANPIAKSVKTDKKSGTEISQKDNSRIVQVRPEKEIPSVKVYPCDTSFYRKTGKRNEGALPVPRTESHPAFAVSTGSYFNFGIGYASEIQPENRISTVIKESFYPELFYRPPPFF